MSTRMLAIALKLCAVRAHRTKLAEDKYRQAERAVEQARLVREQAKRSLDQITALRDAELETMKKRVLSYGVSGSAVEAAMNYTRQLEIKARAAEVQFSRADGEWVRAKIARDQAYGLLLEARARQEIAQRLLQEQQRAIRRADEKRDVSRMDDLSQILLASGAAN